MKTSLDPRHTKRQHLVQELFSVDFHNQKTSETTKEIIEHKESIDSTIERAASEFPVNKINKIDLAILRLAVYELLIVKREPSKVIIDEAIELAKEYGGETSPAFINGALGNILAHAASQV